MPCSFCNDHTFECSCKEKTEINEASKVSWKVRLLVKKVATFVSPSASFIIEEKIDAVVRGFQKSCQVLIMDFKFSSSFFKETLWTVNQVSKPQTPEAEILVWWLVFYDSFSALLQLWTNFFEEITLGHELQLLTHKVHDRLIHNSFQDHSQINKNTKNSSYRSNA
jgi:hypothetical protein